MKICLTTYYNQKYKDVGELCLLSLKKYAAYHNYDVRLHNEIVSDRPPAWNKILVVQKLLEENYDYVFWLDADALILKYDQDIADEIEADKDLYMVNLPAITPGFFPGMGMFLIKNTPWSKWFLENSWSKDQYTYHSYWENSAVIDLLGLAGQLPIRDKVKFDNIAQSATPDKTLLGKIKWLPHQWHQCDYFKNKNGIIIHYTGLPLWMRKFFLLRDALQNGIAEKNSIEKKLMALGKNINLAKALYPAAYANLGLFYLKKICRIL